MWTNYDLLKMPLKSDLVEQYILAKKLDVALAKKQIFNWGSAKPLPKSHPINIKLNRPLSQSQIRRLGLQCVDPPRSAP